MTRTYYVYDRRGRKPYPVLTINLEALKGGKRVFYDQIITKLIHKQDELSVAGVYFSDRRLKEILRDVKHNIKMYGTQVH